MDRRMDGWMVDRWSRGEVWVLTAWEAAWLGLGEKVVSEGIS